MDITELFAEPSGAPVTIGRTRMWQTGPNSIVAKGMPSEVAPVQSDPVSEMNSELAWWDEPQQESYHPNFEQNLKQAKMLLEKRFTALGPKATKADVKRAIEDVSGQFAFDTPEVAGALKSMFKDKLPGTAPQEIAKLRSFRNMLDLQEMTNETQKRAQKYIPHGYYSDIKTGRLYPISETPEQKRTEATKEESEKQKLHNANEIEEAEKYLKSHPKAANLALYNKGTFGKLELVAVDTNDETYPLFKAETNWTLYRAPVIDASKTKQGKRGLFGRTTEQPVSPVQPPGQPPVQTQSQPVQPPAIQEGTTIINRQTGQRMILQNGQWTPIQ